MGKDRAPKDKAPEDKTIERFPNGCYPGENPCKYDRYGHLKKEFRHKAPKEPHKNPPPAPRHEEKKKPKPDEKPRVSPEMIV
ncbi:MAG: hypothetical protein WBK91_09865 [Alphaproteobacteria bacterium]